MEHQLKTSFIIPLIVAASFCHAQSPLSATDALKLAAQNRPALKSAKLGVEQARNASRALGAYAPTTFLIGASSRSELGSNDQDLQLSQPLDFFGRRRAGQRLGEAGIQLSLAEYVLLATDLQNDVLTAYAESVANQHQKEVAAELLKISEGLLIATQRRFDEGKVAETQVTRASIEFERAKQSAELTSADLNASLEKLSGLLGTETSSIALEADAKIEPLVNPAIDGRPDLLVLRSQVQIAEADAGVARTSNRPELSAQIVRSPWSNDPGYFAGRLQLSWALFDHGKARNETSAAKKRAEAARKLLEDATGRARAEVKAAQIALEARQSRIARYEAILVSARDLVAKSQKGYSEGFSTQIDVLESTRALREVEQELVEARQQLSLAVIAQYRASGFLAEVLK
jgi:outer membrane protein TolC